MVTYNNASDYQVTQYNLLTGGATNLLNNVAPSSTSGVPVISQGSSSQPIFGTAVVAGGGTGSTSFTAYGPVVAASTTTGALTSITPSATSGVPFISQGSSSNPAFGTAVVAGGGTGITSATAYGLICGGTSSTGAFQVVTPGATTGYVLQTNGSSALPSWVVNSGVGTLVLLSSQSASGLASVNFTSLISGTYTCYLALLSSCSPASGATPNLNLNFSVNNGSSYLSSGYQSGNTYCVYDSASFSNSFGTSKGLIAPGQATTSSINTFLFFYNLDTSATPYYSGLMSFGSATMACGIIQGFNSTTSGVNAIQFIYDAGNFASGTITLYGVLQ